MTSQRNQVKLTTKRELMMIDIYSEIKNVAQHKTNFISWLTKISA